MANTPQDDRFYKGNTLVRAFAIASVVMLIFTIWMVMDDYGREWKGYQRRFWELKKKRYGEMEEKAKGNVDEAKLKELKDQIAKNEDAVKAQTAQRDKLNEEITYAKTQEKNATIQYQDAKANWDVEKYHYESHFGHKVAEGVDESTDPKAKSAYDQLMKNWDKVLERRNAANQKSQALDAKTDELAALNAEKVKLDKEWKTLYGEVDRIAALKKGAQFNFTTLLRSAPVLDLADPAFRLQQIVLPTIRDDIYFAQVQKVDRCQTCHQAIDTPGFENEPEPFKTHPRLDLILGSRSPHPIDKIGCTVCHDGRGQSTEFIRSAHTPRNEEQKKEWQRKYGWHEMEHVIEKMIPLGYTEGKCRVCHRQTEYVPRAEKLTAAYQLIRGAGCYGCHKIEGWDHMRKPAPSLKRITGKLTRDFMVKWVRNPKSYNEFARMPAPFHQSNITTDEHHTYQEAEIFAIVDYIRGLSEPYQPDTHLPLGNAAHGKELFGSVGCLGCHQMDDFGHPHDRFGVAPDLSTVGSKVNQAWLQSWLHNPRHFWADTNMPSLRLNDQEISDLSAYLLGKHNAEFEQLPTGDTSVETQKKVLRLYLMRDPRMAPVTNSKVDTYIDGLSPDDVTKKLGENAVSRYGCFGCHEIKGFETTQGIGTELTEEGSKPINKFDFGLIEMDHSNHDFFERKLENTRIFDKGEVKEYLDLLRMPQYGFNDHERDLLITALMGFTSQKISPPAAKQLSAAEFDAEEGMRVIHRYNCQGCHMVQGLYQALADDDPKHDDHEKERHQLEGRVLDYYPDDETLGPPPLVTEGKRVHPQWAYNFVNDPSNRLRYRLKIRMPTFQLANEELDHVVTYFGKSGDAQLPVEPVETIHLTGERMNQAKTLFTKLQCLNCHTVNAPERQYTEADGSRGLAPDFARAHDRLRKDWIVQLLKDPQKMIPGTRMPGFWPEGNSPAPEILKGDAEAQQELLAEYILSLGQSFGGPSGKHKTSTLNFLPVPNHKVAAASKKGRASE